MDDNPATNDWRNLSNSDSVSSSMPAWSPDGTQIAYVRTTDNNSDIWKMNAEGSGHALVETNPKHDINPDWQPMPVCTRSVNGINDPLTGTAGKDVLCGNNSNNVINGAGGNDII